MSEHTTSISPSRFYCEHSKQSDPGAYRNDVLTWPKDVAGLMEVIQGLLIYDVGAKPFYGCDLSPERQDDIFSLRVDGTDRGDRNLSQAHGLDVSLDIDKR